MKELVQAKFNILEFFIQSVFRSTKISTKYSGRTKKSISSHLEMENMDLILYRYRLGIYSLKKLCECIPAVLFHLVMSPLSRTYIQPTQTTNDYEVECISHFPYLSIFQHTISRAFDLRSCVQRKRPQMAPTKLFLVSSTSQHTAFSASWDIDGQTPRSRS